MNSEQKAEATINWYNSMSAMARVAAIDLGVPKDRFVDGWLEYVEHFKEALAQGLVKKREFVFVPTMPPMIEPGGSIGKRIDFTLNNRSL